MSKLRKQLLTKLAIVEILEKRVKGDQGIMSYKQLSGKLASDYNIDLHYQGASKYEGTMGYYLKELAKYNYKRGEPILAMFCGHDKTNVPDNKLFECIGMVRLNLREKMSIRDNNMDRLKLQFCKEERK